MCAILAHLLKKKRAILQDGGPNLKTRACFRKLLFTHVLVIDVGY